MRGSSLHHPWPQVHHFVADESPASEPWLQLPSGGGDVVWSLSVDLTVARGAPPSCQKRASLPDHREQDKMCEREIIEAKDL
jgi:hypothetical protein